MNNQSYDKQWYQKLNKPPWTPPNYTFGIIWPILYTLMFISLYLVYKNKNVIHTVTLLHYLYYNFY